MNRATVERKCLLKEMRRTAATLSQLAAIFGHSVIKENAANLEKREYEKKGDGIWVKLNPTVFISGLPPLQGASQHISIAN